MPDSSQQFPGLVQAPQTQMPQLSGPMFPIRNASGGWMFPASQAPQTPVPTPTPTPTNNPTATPFTSTGNLFLDSLKPGFSQDMLSTPAQQIQYSKDQQTALMQGWTPWGNQAAFY